jgi:hypothetical protein
MNISSFDDLIMASQLQTDAQRLLFVFAGVELPDDCTPEQRAGFEAGEGGALVPLMCVDKTPDEISNFTALVDEANDLAQPWRIVFVAALSGAGGVIPTSSDAESSLKRMEEAIKQGNFAGFIPFDQQGQPVMFG